MRRIPAAVVVASILVSACGGSEAAVGTDPPAPITLTETEALLAASDVPVVLNVWASWCVPCRSEAPLLDAAARLHEDDVRFVMLDVRDQPGSAAAFIAEFYGDAPMEHFADASGDIPVRLGGSRGVPLTFFYAQGGELVEVHFGVIDERTLALQIDELLAR